MISPGDASSKTFDPIWEEIHRQRDWGRYPSEPVIRAVMRKFARVPPAERRAVRILDLGCGIGSVAWFLSREGFSVDAVDGSETAIRKTTERLQKEDLLGPFIRLSAMDFTAGMPWPDTTYDLVIDNCSLYCNPMDSMRATIRRCHGVLNPGGSFLSFLFTDRTWGYGCGTPGPQPGTFTQIAEGPFAGRGFTQFLGRRDIDGLFADFTRIDVDRVLWTEQGGLHEVEQWQVHAYA